MKRIPDYRRHRVPGGCFFFTVNLLERHGNDLLTRHVDLLRSAVRTVRQARPFTIDAWVVLPDHLHCVWTLPPGDDDFSTRWRLIKTIFARSLPANERRSAARRRHRERGIWQRRFWEHGIRDDADFAAHVDYVHFNPVKHGYVAHIAHWPYSTFEACVRCGLYPADWLGPWKELCRTTQPESENIRRVTLRIEPALRGLKALGEGDRRASRRQKNCGVEDGEDHA